MNRTPYQSEDKVLIERYRGPALATIRTRPARRSLAHLRALAADDDAGLPTRNALTWLWGVIGYPLSRFVKVGILLPLIVATMFFGISFAMEIQAVPRMYCHIDCYMQRHTVHPKLPHPYLDQINALAGPEILLGVIVLLLLLGLVFKRRGARYASFPPTHSFAVAQYWGSNDIAGTWVGQREPIDPAP